jgi:hypothetical protein
LRSQVFGLHQQYLQQAADLETNVHD